MFSSSLFESLNNEQFNQKKAAEISRLYQLIIIASQEEKEATEEAKAVNASIIKYARFLQEDLSEWPLEEQWGIQSRLDSFYTKVAQASNPCFRIGIAEHQRALEALAKEHKDDYISRLIANCEAFSQLRERLITEIFVTGGVSNPARLAGLIDTFKCELDKLIKDSKNVQELRKLISAQSNRLSQLIISLQAAEAKDTPETKAIKARIIRQAQELQREFLPNCPFAEQETVLPAIDRFFERQQWALNPCFQTWITERRIALDDLARDNKEDKDIPQLLGRYKTLRQERQELLDGILTGAFTLEVIPDRVKDLSEKIAALTGDIDQFLRKKALSDKKALAQKQLVTKDTLIKEIINNLKIDPTNPEHITAWHAQTSFYLGGYIGGVSPPEVKKDKKFEQKKVPTRVNALMKIAAKYIENPDNYQNADVFIQEIEKARKQQPSWWNNPLSWVSRQQAAIDLYEIKPAAKDKPPEFEKIDLFKKKK